MLTPAERRALFASAIRADEQTSTDYFIRFAGFKTTDRGALESSRHDGGFLSDHLLEP
jgi:hypothetical protein